MRTVRYENKWPWGLDIVHIATDGKATVGVSIQDGFDFAFIHDLVVHESVRKQGRGRMLLILAELEAVQNLHCHLVVLRVVPGSWMEQWYRKNGYSDYENEEYKAEGYIELGKLL